MIMSIKRLVEDRWFAFADLCLVLTGIILWMVNPHLGFLPLLVAIFPWIFRVIAGNFPFTRTPLDFFLGIFLITAGIGLWAAYNSEDAWAKFWLLVGGIVLFYALAGQPRENIWVLARLLGAIGIVVTIFFLVTNNWQENPSRVEFINQSGIWWMRANLLSFSSEINQDYIAGIGIVSLPVLAALGFEYWGKKRYGQILWLAPGGVIVFLGFLAAISNGAAVAMSIGVLAWLIISSKPKLALLINHRLALLILLGVVSVIVLSIIFIGKLHDVFLALVYVIENQYISKGRPELIQGALKLIGDFPIIGGGLNSFPGLYSEYILVIPFFSTSNSYNQFLDVGVEQGIIGMLSIIAVYLSSLWFTFTKAAKSTFKYLLFAIFTSLIMIVILGLDDDIIYSQYTVMTAFLLPGLAIGAIQPSKNKEFIRRQGHSKIKIQPHTIWVTTVLSAVVLGIICANPKSFLSTFYSNYGAVLMAKESLKEFPTNSWNIDQFEDFRQSSFLFKQAIKVNPTNHTANYRLGLIAMHDGDYSTAVPYLSKAYAVDPDHRGIIKNLGYSEVWTGDIEQAVQLLKSIPETEQEMEIYSWWWHTKGRDDLANQAILMVKVIQDR